MDNLVEVERKPGAVMSLWVTVKPKTTFIGTEYGNAILRDMLSAMSAEIAKLTVEKKTVLWNIRTVFNAQNQTISLVAEIVS